MKPWFIYYILSVGIHGYDIPEVLKVFCHFRGLVLKLQTYVLLLRWEVLRCTWASGSGCEFISLRGTPVFRLLVARLRRRCTSLLPRTSVTHFLLIILACFTLFRLLGFLRLFPHGWSRFNRNLQSFIYEIAKFHILKTCWLTKSLKIVNYFLIFSLIRGKIMVCITAWKTD